MRNSTVNINRMSLRVLVQVFVVYVQCIYILLLRALVLQLTPCSSVPVLHSKHGAAIAIIIITVYGVYISQKLGGCVDARCMAPAS